MLKKGFISIYNFAVEVNTQRMEHLQNIGEKFVRRLYPVVNNFFLQSFFNFWAMVNQYLNRIRFDYVCVRLVFLYVCMYVCMYVCISTIDMHFSFVRAQKSSKFETECGHA
jgi:hypothetical protein